MKRTQEFFKSTVIGGVLVLLPLAIFVFILTWIFGMIRGAIGPLTKLLMANSPIQGFVADTLVILFLIVLCFLIGAIVRTRFGKWFYSFLETSFLLKAPGYSLIKETVIQFMGQKKSPFSSVALAQIFQNEVMVTGFITDEHTDGSYTIFVPTGPNPTSGVIYHLPQRYVHPVKVTIEEAMRSIISCGAGSSKLVSQYLEKDNKK